MLLLVVQVHVACRVMIYCCLIYLSDKFRLSVCVCVCAIRLCIGEPAGDVYVYLSGRLSLCVCSLCNPFSLSSSFREFHVCLSLLEVW